MDGVYVSLKANVTGTNITQHYYPNEGSKETDKAADDTYDID